MNMREPLLWTSALLFCALKLTASLPPEHAIVFPRLLESRDATKQTEEKILVVNDDITLHLKPSSVFSKEFTVDTIEEGSPVKYYFQGAEYERNLYRDDRNKASLTIHEENGIQVEGLIGSTLRIKPVDGVERSVDGHVAHVLYKVMPRMSGILKKKGAKNTKIKARNGPDTATDHHGDLPKERQYYDYTVEVYLVLDSYYVNGFKSTKVIILAYLSRFITMVNVYLGSMRYSLSVKVVGVQLNQKKPNYIKKIKHHLDKVNADATLQAFREQYENSDEYKTSDVFMFLTRLDIVEGDDISYDASVTGSSMVGSACTIYKVGSSEDEPYTYDGVYAFVREVSHLVGIVDDGKEAIDNNWVPGNTGARRCRPESGYIMGTADAKNPSIWYNHFQYSRCSKYQFETFISGRGAECLTRLNFQSKTNILTEECLLTEYDMDYICGILHDNYENVKYVPEPERLRHCRFRCQSPKDFRNRSVQFDHFMAEGTKCTENPDSNQVCEQGVCRYKN